MLRQFHALTLTCLVASGCVRPRLGEECTRAPSRAAWQATGAQGRIEGDVRDLDEQVPIGNIEIRLADLERRQRTTAEGRFWFDSVPDGRHVIVTEGSVYQAWGDTLILSPEGGMRARLELSTRRDVLARCTLYRP